MDRREFLSLSTTGLVGLGLSSNLSILNAMPKKGMKDYNIVILGDTHFDTEPADVYHSFYNEPTEWLNRVQRAEFARNGEMWRERCPRLLKRAACLVDKETQMAFQMGDLIQGDCGKGEVHIKMLDDVMNRFKGEFGGLPFVTVVGNHDIRGVDAEKAYHDYMPKRISQEIGKEVAKTTFSFNIGDDAYIFVDFNTPDDAEIEKLLAETKGARHTFVVSHGPIIPPDDRDCRWIFHGGASPEHTAARLHFRKEFAQRNAIVLCGHVHTTEFVDWYGDGGRITQMTMNSVWSKPELAQYSEKSSKASEYGSLRKNMETQADGSKLTDESAFFDEYRSGIRSYTMGLAAGSFKMNVGKKHISIDFYGGDSTQVTKSFIIR